MQARREIVRQNPTTLEAAIFIARHHEVVDLALKRRELSQASKWSQTDRPSSQPILATTLVPMVMVPASTIQFGQPQQQQQQQREQLN